MPVPSRGRVAERDHDDVAHPDGDLLVASRAAVGLGRSDGLDAAQLGGVAAQRVGDKARRRATAGQAAAGCTAPRPAAPSSIAPGHASSIAKARHTPTGCTRSGDAWTGGDCAGQGPAPGGVALGGGRTVL